MSKYYIAVLAKGQIMSFVVERPVDGHGNPVIPIRLMFHAVLVTDLTNKAVLKNVFRDFQYVDNPELEATPPVTIKHIEEATGLKLTFDYRS